MTIRNRIERLEQKIPADEQRAAPQLIRRLLHHSAVDGELMAAGDAEGDLEARFGVVVCALDRLKDRQAALSVDEFKRLPLAERLEYLQLSLQQPSEVLQATEVIRRRIRQ